MRHRDMVLVTAPGLPPWPRLYFDQRNRRAIVIAKHPTWRSYQWAFRTAAFFKWMVFFSVMYWGWLYLSPIEPLFRIMALFLVLCFLLPILDTAIRFSGCGFLARQIFATKTVIWASPNAIAFRSWFYRKPVVVWRQWKGQQVRTRFILNRDQDATSQLTMNSAKSLLPRHHLDEAMVLEIVVAAVDPRTSIVSRDQMLQRSIPVTEVNMRLARKFTMVFSAATMLTSIGPNESQQINPGIDIDT